MTLSIFIALFAIYYFITICISIGMLIINADRQTESKDIVFSSFFIIFSFTILPVILGMYIADGNKNEFDEFL